MRRTLGPSGFPGNQASTVDFEADWFSWKPKKWRVLRSQVVFLGTKEILSTLEPISFSGNPTIPVNFQADEFSGNQTDAIKL